MNQVLIDLWSKLYNHPLASTDIINKVDDDIKVSVAYGADRFTYTRNKLTSTLALLDMVGGNH